MYVNQQWKNCRFYSTAKRLNSGSEIATNTTSKASIWISAKAIETKVEYANQLAHSVNKSQVDKVTAAGNNFLWMETSSRCKHKWQPKLCLLCRKLWHFNTSTISTNTWIFAIYYFGIIMLVRIKENVLFVSTTHHENLQEGAIFKMTSPGLVSSSNVSLCEIKSKPWISKWGPQHMVCSKC